MLIRTSSDTTYPEHFKVAYADMSGVSRYQEDQGDSGILTRAFSAVAWESEVPVHVHIIRRSLGFNTGPSRIILGELVKLSKPEVSKRRMEVFVRPMSTSVFLPSLSSSSRSGHLWGMGSCRRVPIRQPSRKSRNDTSTPLPYRLHTHNRSRAPTRWRTEGMMLSSMSMPR